MSIGTFPEVDSESTNLNRVNLSREKNGIARVPMPNSTRKPNLSMDIYIYIYIYTHKMYIVCYNIIIVYCMI